MLNAIRQRAGSWIVKVLLLLLVASFAVWGIGDIFYGGGRNPVVAEVGDSEILASELSNEFNRVFNNIQQQFGTGIDREQAIRLGLLQQALQDLISRRLVDLRARDMGLMVDDATIRELIVTNPAFQTGGRFDRSRFEQLLLQSGLTEESYIAIVRQEMLRSMLTGSLIGPVVAPEVLVNALYRHRNEQREGRLLIVETTAMQDVPEPSQQQIEDYHADHETEYTAPEYRDVRFVTVQPEDLLGEIELTDEQIRSTYEQRIDSYRTPARREVQQLLANDESAVREAKAKIDAGTSFEAAGGDGASFSDLGEIRSGQLPGELNEVVFGLDVGTVSEPVQSPLGWHLFQVTHALPEERTPFEEVRDEIERELALQEASDRLPALANALDDELAAGLPLEEAAANVGLDVQDLGLVDRRGQGPEGERPEDMPTASSFLEVVFATPTGETSLLEEADDGSYFVVQVDDIQEPRLKPVDEVRGEIVSAWKAEEQRRLALEKAQSLLARTDDAASFEALAEQPGVSVAPIGPFDRASTGEGPATQAAIGAMFETPPGEVADHVVEVVGGYAVVRTDQIIPADPSEDPQAVDELRQQLSDEMKADVIAQYEQELRNIYPVSIDPAEVERVRSIDSFAPTAGPSGFF